MSDETPERVEREDVEKAANLLEWHASDLASQYEDRMPEVVKLAVEAAEETARRLRQRERGKVRFYDRDEGDGSYALTHNLDGYERTFGWWADDGNLTVDPLQLSRLLRADRPDPEPLKRRTLHCDNCGERLEAGGCACTRMRQTVPGYQRSDPEPSGREACPHCDHPKREHGYDGCSRNCLCEKDWLGDLPGGVEMAAYVESDPDPDPGNDFIPAENDDESGNNDQRLLADRAPDPEPEEGKAETKGAQSLDALITWLRQYRDTHAIQAGVADAERYARPTWLVNLDRIEMVMRWIRGLPDEEDLEQARELIESRPEVQRAFEDLNRRTDHEEGEDG